MLAVTLVLGVLAIISVYFASRASMGVGRDVRGAVFERVQHFSAREMTRFGTPSLITRNTNDVQQVQLFLQIALTILLTAPILAIGGVIMAIRENATLSLTLVVIVPLMAGVIGTLVAISVPLFRQMQGRVDKITEVLREQIMGIRVVRAFIRTESEQRRFDRANGDLTATALRVNRIFALAMRPGTITGIIGGTGSGKTTLLTLVTRGFDATGGAVLVDGVDVREQSLDRLWSRIGLVPQTAYLFKGTVADNLRFGNPDATDAELWRALEVAQARDFVAAMVGELEAAIDQGGTNVSGGQRQRLAIARALVKRPAIYLFDDCFSALDAATDARLRRALRAETGDANVVIVAQRVSTILHADQIVVLDEGRVVGIGTHDELMAGCVEYRAT